MVAPLPRPLPDVISACWKTQRWRICFGPRATKPPGPPAPTSAPTPIAAFAATASVRSPRTLQRRQLRLLWRPQLWPIGGLLTDLTVQGGLSYAAAAASPWACSTAVQLSDYGPGREACTALAACAREQARHSSTSSLYMNKGTFSTTDTTTGPGRVSGYSTQTPMLHSEFLVRYRQQRRCGWTAWHPD